MRKMLNTLYITSTNAYLSLNGEVVEVNFEDGTKKGIPLHTLEHIVSFSYKGASPALIGKCESENVTITFFTPFGKYLSAIGSATKGNILLRRAQYRIYDNPEQALIFSRNFIVGKLYNSKNQLMRYVRDHPLQIDCKKVQQSATRIDEYLHQVIHADSLESVRGIEGLAALEYFKVFDEMILSRKEIFQYKGRSRRPPLDKVNSLLSFAYSLLSSECSSALVSVGLDPYAGFLHKDRPGRKSLALDLMEELRSVYADRFVLSLINNRIINNDDFSVQESGAVYLNEDGRRKFLAKWQARKREEFTHPFLKEKITWGLAPYSQAILLSRCIREDLNQYPPLFWR